MARKKDAPCWRPAFLRALGRSGNVTQACRVAGVDKTTVYLARRRDVGFAARWVGALARAEGAPPPRFTRSPSPAKAGKELVVRNSRAHGAQLVKASAGRWSQGVEKRFLAALMQTGCVRSAAQACGLSTNALYYRKKRYPEFAMRWRAAEAEAGERLPALLTAAAIAAFDPEIEDEAMPPVSVSEALHICRMKGLGAGAGAGPVAALEPIERVRARVLAKLEAIEAAEGAA